jgi:hypothetical protein
MPIAQEDLLSVRPVLCCGPPPIPVDLRDRKIHESRFVLTLNQALYSRMAQLTIYLDAESQRLIEAAAAREGSSLSRWARGDWLRQQHRKDGRRGSPFSELFGSISDESSQRF